jgi:hypothetical protein
MPIFNPSYTYIEDFHGSRDIDTVPNFNMEIAAPLLVSDIEELFENMRAFNKPRVFDNLNIYIQGDLKKLGDGLTCSNFRNKNHSGINNQVVQNIFKLMTCMDKPKYMTSYPRSVRTITVNLDGLEKFGKEVVVLNNKQYDNTKTDILNKFLEVHMSETWRFKRFCEGARYNTYLADCISFILMMFHTIDDQEDIFEVQYLEPYIVDGSSMSPVESNGRVWNPDPTHNYLYHKETDERTNMYKYYVPKNDTISIIYNAMFQLFVVGYDNHFKSMVRIFLRNTYYLRWSDFWINDIDDGMTILMIRNAYNDCELSEEDIVIRDYLDSIIRNL